MTEIGVFQVEDIFQSTEQIEEFQLHYNIVSNWLHYLSTLLKTGFDEKLLEAATRGLIRLPRGKFKVTSPPLTLPGRPLSEFLNEVRG